MFELRLKDKEKIEATISKNSQMKKRIFQVTRAYVNSCNFKIKHDCIIWTKKCRYIKLKNNQRIHVQRYVYHCSRKKNIDNETNEIVLDKRIVQICPKESTCLEPSHLRESIMTDVNNRHHRLDQT